MKVLGSTKTKVTKDENDENVLHLEVTEVVLIDCNIFNNNYQQDSIVLYIFVSKNSLVYKYRYFTFLKTFNSEFSYIEVWFPHQNSEPLEIEDKITIALVIN